MRFKDAVRRRRVVGPNRPGFSHDEWKKCAEEFSEDEIDVQLAQAGVWFFSKMDEARTKHQLVNSADVSRYAKLRAIVAGSNLAMLEMQSEITTLLDQMEKQARKTFSFDEFKNLKLTTKHGASLPLDDCAESVVCGTLKALRFVLRDKVGNGRGKASIEAALHDINLGVYYYALEANWERVLWEDYEITFGAPVVIRPRTTGMLDAFVATRARQDRLSETLFRSAAEHFRKFEFHPKNTYIRPVVAIAKEGRRQRLILGDVCAVPASSIDAFVMRHAVRLQYYADIWFTKSKKVQGLNLDLVVKAWEVVSTASVVLTGRLVIQAPVHADINANAPALEIHALCTAIKDAVNVSYEIASRLVDFLTYEGKDSDDLWAQPLVRVAENRVAPVLLTARSPELRRAIDIWLAGLGIAVQEKGHIFNRHVQDVLARTAASSKFLNEAAVISGAFKLPIGKGKDEEIDLLLVLGPFVVVGECKCQVVPDEPRDWHKHRENVQKAVAQAKRKTQAVVSNKATFVDQMHKRGVTLPYNFEVISLVVLNTGLHAGVPFDGVAIVDLPILETYFTGYIANGTVERDDGRLDIVPELSLYGDALEAWQNFGPYLLAPPQLRQLREGVKDCIVPLATLDDPSELIAVLHSREVEVDMTRYVLPNEDVDS